DQIEVQLTANVHEQSYLWQWETRIHDASSDRFRAEFKQSSFNAIPFTLKDLQKGSDRHVPQLDQDGCIDHFILSQMQGHQSVGEIAVKLEAEFPEVINSYQTALNRVAGISKRYSK
ncbi:MAG: hypothetical protein JKY95_10600, partial [Planctomycetaceae bacterium]|nr:hypothetical protein [Planctomycetaceae bacterium]